MDNKGRQPVEPARRGITRDLSRLKKDGVATAAELRDFINQTRGRSPQEVLGMVAQSNLTHGVIVATVLTVVGMGLMTAIPYALKQKEAAAKTTAPAAAKATDAAATPAADKTAETKPEGDKTAGTPKDGDNVLKKLGMDEVKQSSTEKNPLEDKSDDLLNDLK